LVGKHERQIMTDLIIEGFVNRENWQTR